MSGIGGGWNKKIWDWIESIGIDYGKVRKIQIDIDVYYNTEVQAVTAYNVSLNSESYQYELVARGKGQTPELLAWIKELGFKYGNHLEISLDPGRPVEICATMFVEKELLERLPGVLHLMPVEKEETNHG